MVQPLCPVLRLMIECEIPYKFPSLNEYTRACRSGWQKGSYMKKKIQKDIGMFIKDLPVFEKPIIIHFLWVEENKRRDYDNIAFAKKFILDAMQEQGRLKNDDRKHVVGFSDDFEYGSPTRVILRIEERG